MNDIVCRTHINWVVIKINRAFHIHHPYFGHELRWLHNHEFLIKKFNKRPQRNVDVMKDERAVPEVH